MSGGWTSFRTPFPPSWGTSLNRDFTPDDLRPELKAAGIDGTILVQSLDKLRRDAALPRCRGGDRLHPRGGWLGAARRSAGLRPRDSTHSKRARSSSACATSSCTRRTRAGCCSPRCRNRWSNSARQAGVRGDHQHAGADGHGARHRAAHARSQHRAEPLGRPPLPEKGWEPWASQIVEAAKYPNISVKLSVGGDVVWRWPWKTDEIRRYSDHVMQHFGASRDDGGQQLAGGAASAAASSRSGAASRI